MKRSRSPSSNINDFVCNKVIEYLDRVENISDCISSKIVEYLDYEAHLDLLEYKKASICGSCYKHTQYGFNNYRPIICDVCNKLGCDRCIVYHNWYYASYHTCMNENDSCEEDSCWGDDGISIVSCIKCINKTCPGCKGNVIPKDPLDQIYDSCYCAKCHKAWCFKCAYSEPGATRSTTLYIDGVRYNWVTVCNDCFDE